MRERLRYELINSGLLLSGRKPLHPPRHRCQGAINIIVNIIKIIFKITKDILNIILKIINNINCIITDKNDQHTSHDPSHTSIVTFYSKIEFLLDGDMYIVQGV